MALSKEVVDALEKTEEPAVQETAPQDIPEQKQEAPADVIDIDLSATAKKRFRFNSDNSRILELNISDMSVISRLSSSIAKLEKLAVSVSEFAEVEETEDGDVSLKMAGEKFDKIDDEMRAILDEIFSANVSEVTCPKSEGSMYDPFNGSFRFELIIDKLLSLYTDNIQEQFRKMEKKTVKHTAKYTKKKRK